jgi:hypothetical protein
MSDISPTKDQVVDKGSDVSNGTQPEEERSITTSDYGNIGIIRRLSTKKLWFRSKGSEAKALIKMSRLDRTRWTTLVFRHAEISNHGYVTCPGQ